MNKLEEANRIASRRVSISAPVDRKPIPDICDEGAAAVLAAEDLTGSVPVPCPRPEGAVADWITNARRSIEALGVYVSMGSASVTVDMLGEGGSDAASSDEDYDDEEEEVGEEYDAAEPQDDEPPCSHQSGMSPASTTSTTDGVPGKKAGSSAKLAILPTEDAPFGLMANLSLSLGRRAARRAAAREHDEEDEVGLASRHYFRPSAYDPVSLLPLTSFMVIAGPAPQAPLVDEQLQPPILRNGIIRPDEAEKLFQMCVPRVPSFGSLPHYV